MSTIDIRNDEKVLIDRVKWCNNDSFDLRKTQPEGVYVEVKSHLCSESLDNFIKALNKVKEVGWL